MNAKSQVALGVVGGMLLGAVVGMVVAPRTGKEAREVLHDKANRLRLRVKGHENEVEDPAEHYVELLR